MGGCGSVVTSAGLVFAATMMSFGISELKVLAAMHGSRVLWSCER